MTLKSMTDYSDLTEIKGFFGPYRWLSNFCLADVEYSGVMYRSNEHAYQAAKTLSERERAWFTDPKTTCGKAKRLGLVVTMRDDWNEIKYSVMYDLNRQKYFNHEDLKQMLLDTGMMYLEETNTWGDRYWGVCDGVGENNLGKILMQIRKELKNG
jgi:ribA/ribD-fused uncharacterized protein